MARCEIDLAARRIAGHLLGAGRVPHEQAATWVWAMSPERQREIAALGGKRPTSEEGRIGLLAKTREAGRRGGQAVSRDRAHLVAMGQGGRARGRKQRLSDWNIDFQAVSRRHRTSCASESKRRSW